jgi:lysozyme
MRFEGCYLTPYLCPAGIPTIGFGATYYQDGTAVTLLDAPITKDEAIALLVWMVETVYLPAVRKLCPNINLPERLAAIIDFCFNLGAKKLAVSTLRKRINSEHWVDVPDELLKWNKAGGRVLSGLTARRKTEGALC